MPRTTRSDTYLNGDVYRTCSMRCGELLLLNDANFYAPPGRDFQSWCRACGAESNRQRRANRRSRAAFDAPMATRSFGVEIEFTGLSVYQARLALEDAGIRIFNDGRDYTHQITANWKIVHDGSLSSGGEAVSPPLSGARDMAQVGEVTAALRGAGAHVNSQCGLHVHHEVTDLSSFEMGLLARAWFNAQGTIEAFVAGSRRRSTWCQRLMEREVNMVEALTTTDLESNEVLGLRYINRYRNLNFAAFPKYGTVEMRQHGGTLNARKIAAWTAFGQAFIAAAKAGHVESPASPEALLERLQVHGGLSAEDATFMQRRADRFSAVYA